MLVMTDDRIWTADELEELTPDERHRLLNERVVTNLAEVSPDFLASARSKGRSLLEEREAINTNEQ